MYHLHINIIYCLDLFLGLNTDFGKWLSTHNKKSSLSETLNCAPTKYQPASEFEKIIKYLTFIKYKLFIILTSFNYEFD